MFYSVHMEDVMLRTFGIVMSITLILIGAFAV